MISNSNIIDKGIDTSDATATSIDIINGKTAYINNEKIVGELLCAKIEDATFTYVKEGYNEFYNSATKFFDSSFLIVNKDLNLGDIVSFDVHGYKVIGVYMNFGNSQDIKCMTASDIRVLNLIGGESYPGIIYRTNISS